LQGDFLPGKAPPRIDKVTVWLYRPAKKLRTTVHLARVVDFGQINRRSFNQT